MQQGSLLWGGRLVEEVRPQGRALRTTRAKGEPKEKAWDEDKALCKLNNLARRLRACEMIQHSKLRYSKEAQHHKDSAGAAGRVRKIKPKRITKTRSSHTGVQHSAHDLTRTYGSGNNER